MDGWVGGSKSRVKDYKKSPQPGPASSVEDHSLHNILFSTGEGSIHAGIFSDAINNSH